MSKGKIIKQIVITVRQEKPNMTVVDLNCKVWPHEKIHAIEVIEVLTNGMDLVLEHRAKRHNS